jgi:hypothetical protein
MYINYVHFSGPKYRFLIFFNRLENFKDSTFPLYTPTEARNPPISGELAALMAMAAYGFYLRQRTGADQS